MTTDIDKTDRQIQISRFNKCLVSTTDPTRASHTTVMVCHFQKNNWQLERLVYYFSDLYSSDIPEKHKTTYKLTHLSITSYLN